MTSTSTTRITSISYTCLLFVSVSLLTGTYRPDDTMCYQTGLPLDKFWALHPASTNGPGEEASRFHTAGGGKVKP